MPERKVHYEKLPHQADGGFVIKAPSLERLFIDASLSLTDHLVTLDLIKDTEKRSITAHADKKEALLVNWLTAVLTLFKNEKFLSKRVVFNHFDGKKIKATLFGELYEPVRHGSVPQIGSIECMQLQMGEISNSELFFIAKVVLSRT